MCDKNKKIKKSSISLKRNEDKLCYKSLTIIDVTCPICLSILIKPVSLPCNHCLCMVCFERTVSESNLTCPLCRKRISVWVRRETKSKTLLDEKLWEQIQENFKDQVNAKMKGEDSESNTFTSTFPPKQLSTPGEIRKEYEKQLEKLRKEEETRKLMEEKASENLILELQKEEMIETRHSNNEKDLSNNDFEFAKELRMSQIQEKLKNLKSSKSQKKKSVRSVGPLDNYIMKSKDDSSPESAEKTCSQEIQYPSSASTSLFTCHPVHPAGNVPSSSRVFRDITSHYSSESESEFDSEENVKKMESKAKRFLNFKEINSRKCDSPQEIDLINKEHTSEKRSPNRDKTLLEPLLPDYDQIKLLSTALDNNEIDQDENLLRLIEEQKILEEKIKQEKEDHLLALQLQKNLKQVDRSKGSEDQYCLRNKEKYINSCSSPSCRSSSPSTSRSSGEKTPYCKSSSKLRQTTLLESLSKRQRRV